MSLLVDPDLDPWACETPTVPGAYGADSADQPRTLPNGLVIETPPQYVRRVHTSTALSPTPDGGFEPVTYDGMLTLDSVLACLGHALPEPGQRLDVLRIDARRPYPAWEPPAPRRSGQPVDLLSSIIDVAPQIADPFGDDFDEHYGHLAPTAKWKIRYAHRLTEPYAKDPATGSPSTDPMHLDPSDEVAWRLASVHHENSLINTDTYGLLVPTHNRDGFFTWTDTERTTYRVVRFDDSQIGLRVFYSTQTRGRAANGRGFSSWHTNKVVSLRRNGDGRWIQREMSKTKRTPQNAAATRHQQFEFFLSDAHPGEPLGHGVTDIERLARAYMRAHPELTERTTIGTLYPVAEHYMPPARRQKSADEQAEAAARELQALRFVRSLRADERRPLREAASAADLAANLFGARNVRRDLVKETAQADYTALLITAAFRDLVPVDWIVSTLRRIREESGETNIGFGRHDIGNAVQPSYLRLRSHLRRLTRTELRRLLDGLHAPGAAARHGEDMHFIKDLLLWRPGRYVNVHSWRDLHDQAVAYGDLIRSKSRKPFTTKLPALAKALNGTTAGGRTIVIATHEESLHAWGSSMGHCIAGYGRDLGAGTSWLGAVYEDGELIGNFEVAEIVKKALPKTVEDWDAEARRPRLMQLLGRFNKHLPEHVLTDVEDHLTGRAGIDCGKYWGQVVRAVPA